MRFVRTRFHRLLRGIAPAAVRVLAVTAPAVAWAQSGPPQPNLKQTPPVWIGFLLMFVLLAAVMAVSLLPSKRGHQD
jgi:hypothetical protein